MGMKPAQVLGTGGGSLGYPHSYLNSVEPGWNRFDQRAVLLGNAFGLDFEANLTCPHKDTIVANLPRSRILKGDYKAFLPRDVQLQRLHSTFGDRDAKRQQARG
uniref:Uncharacterized protein n=1 Tax=Bionectria ochroleuca TaxID=29856 RepID=A0A0B7JUR2_BIOOC